MKKLFLSSLLIAAMCTSVLSQNEGVQIEWGDKTEIPKKHALTGMVGNQNTGYLQITEIPKKQVGFMRFDNKLEFQETTFEDLPKTQKYMLFESFFEVKDRAYMIFSDYDKKVKSEKMIVREIDVQNGGFKNEGETLIETEGKVTGSLAYTGFYSWTKTDKFKVRLSEDENNILVFYGPEVDQKKTDKDYPMVYMMYDNNWKELWKKEVKIPTEISIIRHLVINGEVYIFALTRSPNDKDLKKTDTYDGMSVFHLSEEGKMKEHEVDLYNKNFYFNIYLGEVHKNGILVSGHYRGERKGNGAEGYFTAVFNPKTFLLDELIEYPYSQDLITAFETEKSKRKLEKQVDKGKEPVIPSIEMRDIIKRNDGGWYVVSEQYIFYITTHTTRNGTYTNYHYLYQDAIVSAIDKNGKEEFTVKVPKNQHFVNSTYGAGISSFQYADNLYIFSIDAKKNSDLSEGDAPVGVTGALKDCNVVMTKITPNGDVVRHDLYELTKDNDAIIPFDIEEIEPGKLITSSRGKFKLFGKNNQCSSALLYLQK